MRSLKLLGGTIAAAAAAMALTMSAWANPVKTEYAFTTGTNTITVGEDVDSVIGKLGEAGDVKTLTNCANGGKDKAHIYDNFDIYTTQDAKKNTVVESIVLKNDKVATEEGLKVGQTPAKVMEIYPGAKESMGLYTVVLGDTQIVVDCGFSNDKVVSISYENYIAQ